MRVLLINDRSDDTGGAELLTTALRDGLRERGHEALLLSSSAGSDGASTADLTCAGTTGPARRVLRVVNPDAWRAVARAVSRLRPDVVHVRMFLTQLSPLILPPLAGVPSIYHAVWYEGVCPKGTKLLPDGTPCRHPAGWACRREGCLSRRAWPPLIAQQRIWRGLERFDRFVANSGAVAARLREAGLGPVGTIPNGVAVVAPRPALKAPPTVAYAGRLEPEKGVDVLLEAMVEIRGRVPGARLLVAGDGPERRRLETLVRALDLGSTVEMLGQVPRERLDSALSGAWVQAVPSIWEEPFGLAAAEAMMRGTAVVATDRGGLREIVEPQAGSRVPAGDAGALADALSAILGDRERAERLGRRARELALERYRIDRFVDRFVSLYAELAGGDGAASEATLRRR